MAALRTARSAVALAAATLLTAIAALLVLSGTAQARDLNCENFPYQEDAQAVLDANPADPNNLDSNHDGVACETLPHRSTSPTSSDTVTTTDAPTPTEPAVAALVGTDPTTGVTTSDTTATSTTTSDSTDSTTTDSTTTDSTSTSTTTTTSDSNSNSDSDDSDSSSSSSSSADDSSADDKDCADFASQADAQAALTAEPSDPDNLDADDDGIACEDRFGTPGQQVQVHPTGGVDTGGEPADA